MMKEKKMTMQKLMYTSALASLFAAMESGNFIVMIMGALFAHVLMEAAFMMTEEGEKKKED